MSSRKSVGHSKKYAQTMKSFDRSVTRTTNAVSRVAFGQAKRGRSRQNIDTTSDSWGKNQPYEQTIDCFVCCGGQFFQLCF